MKKYLFALCLLSKIAFGQEAEVPALPLDSETDIEIIDDTTLPLEDDSTVEDEDSFRKFVGIPKGYVYNPDLGTTHDYCSYSPDSYLKANFRGPCARHDICYDSSTDKKKCDVNLLKNMKSNCDSAYGKLNPIRYTCYEIATKYFAAVVIHH